jgi:DegV family protein with EDD domain
MTALERMKEERGADIPLHVVDLRLASSPMAMLVEEAVARVEAGMTAQELVRWAEEYRYYAQTIFMVDGLETLHRGGRIPKSVATVGDKLNVKPLLTFSLTGELGIVGVARGRKKGLAKLVDYFRRGCAKDGGNLVVAIGDADAREDGNALAERIKEQFPGARTLRSTIGPTIGCHVGPGMVSCCFWGEDRRSA